MARKLALLYENALLYDEIQRHAAQHPHRTARGAEYRDRRADYVADVLEALGVPILTSERFEADDVIGTLATQAAAAGYDVLVVGAGIAACASLSEPALAAARSSRWATR